MSDSKPIENAPIPAPSAGATGYAGNPVLSGFTAVLLPESTDPQIPIAIFAYADHASRWAREQYHGRHILKRVDIGAMYPHTRKQADTSGFRLKCDDCGDLFNEGHEGELCDGRFYKHCKGTLRLNPAWHNTKLSGGD